MANQTVAPNARVTQRRPLLGVILIGVIAGAFLLSLTCVHAVGMRLVTRRNPQLRAIEQIVSAAGTAHLAWLEARVAGATQPPQSVVDDLERAQACARACYQGGTCSVGIVPPLEDAASRLELSQLRSRLQALGEQVLAKRGPIDRAGLIPDAEPDGTFGEVVVLAHGLVARLREDLLADQRAYAATQVAMALLGLLLAAAIGLQFRVNLRRIRAAHHRLRASETRYAELVDHMGTAVAVYEAVDGGRDFVIREFNRAAERIEGIRRQELLGRTLREVFPGVEAFGLFEVLQRVHRTGQPERLPSALYRDDRHQGWRENYIYRLPSLEVVAVYSDETERVQSQRALEESETRFRTMFEAARDGIFVKDVALRYTQVNDAMAKHLHRSPGELLGRSCTELLGAEGGAALEAVDQRVLAGETLEVEQTMPEAWGGHTFHVIKTPLRNERGEVVGIFGIGRDVTELRRMTAALEESEARFRAITENARELVAIHDPAGRLTYISPAVRRITGHAPEDLLGRDPVELFGPQATQRLKELLSRGLQRPGETIPVPEFAVHRRQGGEAYLEGTARAMPDVRGIEGTVLNLRDVSERRRAEIELRRAQKMEAIGTLASGIAHDFNNILYALLGYAELARDELPPENPSRDRIEQVLRAGRRASGLVRRLLTYARQGEEERQPLELAPVVRETLELLRSTIPSTVRIRSRLDPCGTILGDPDQIQQMLINLCTNACQALQGRKGEMDVTLDEVVLDPDDTRLGPDLGVGRHARITVRDTGEGMDAATVERIFEPYFSTRTRSGGTGLGLAMVHGIIRHHQGAVRVDSAIGQGTTFTVHFPLLDESAWSAEMETRKTWRAS